MPKPQGIHLEDIGLKMNIISTAFDDACICMITWMYSVQNLDIITHNMLWRNVSDP